MSNIEPDHTFTLENGSGIATIYVGEWVINDWDIRYSNREHLLQQHIQVSMAKFIDVVIAYRKGGNDAAWMEYHS